MKGSIQQKGKVFYAVVAVNGKRKWFKGGSTKKAAHKKLNEILPEIDKGTYRELTKAKFTEFSEVWLKSYAEPGVKPSTLAGYKDIIKRLLIPYSGITACLTSLQAPTSVCCRPPKVSICQNSH